MEIIPILLKELDQEAATTRKMLERIPSDKLQWQPHRKSMTIQRLATHLAELPGWISYTLQTSELDFATNGYQPAKIEDVSGLLEYFEKTLAGGRVQLAAATEEDLLLPWILRNGDQILQTYTKLESIRMAYCQTVHHRAQLGVFLRLLDIPIPGSYGPSADEMEA